MPGPSLIGLTGGIAAGKSEALRILADLGVATTSADAIVHDLLSTSDVVGRLTDRWGDELAPSGEVDRGRVASIVFSDRDELHWLESLLHPLVGERIRSWRDDLQPHVPVAVAEIPLLFEGTLESLFDATIAISAPDEERARRAGQRGTGELEGRSERQLSQAEKAARATYAIDNDGEIEDLEEALRALLPRLVAAGR